MKTARALGAAKRPQYLFSDAIVLTPDEDALRTLWDNAPQERPALAPSVVSASSSGGGGILPIAPGAGHLSRRLLYVSTTRDDFGRLLKTPAKSACQRKCLEMNTLSPEVARHQSVDVRAHFVFNSRRLHHLTHSTDGTYRSRSVPSPMTLQKLARFPADPAIESRRRLRPDSSACTAASCSNLGARRVP